MSRRARRLLLVTVLGLTGVFMYQARESTRARHRRACELNQRDIEGAKEQFALEHNEAAPAVFEDLVPAYLPSMPACPSGGAYTLGDLQVPVHCSARGHDVGW